MAVYVAYSDEAGIGDARGEFLVGGFIARKSLWPEINRAWRERVLNGPPKIPYLHMTEIRNPAWRETHGVSYNESECRIAEAVWVLRSTGAMDAVASIIRRDNLQDSIHKLYKRKKAIPRGLDEPDYACYMAYINIVLLRAHKLHPDATRVDFVVSEKETVTKGLRDVYTVVKYWLQQYKPELAPLLGSLRSASMKRLLPLQAADVICWYLQRYYSKQFTRIDENRMWYLLKERDGDLHDWSSDALEEVAQGLIKANLIPK
jgi:hypothetical protein